jgi:UDP-N-acetylglucosamine 1-carboxyvinyltransferase
MNYRIIGGRALSGSVTTNISKNAAVAMLCASLLNRGVTILRKMPHIEEINRLVEVLESIGVLVEWKEDGDMRITPPEKINLKNINRDSAERTRSIAMFIGPLTHLFEDFEIPRPGGCRLGERSMSAHVHALGRLGIEIAESSGGNFRVVSKNKHSAEIVMLEASDTGVENAIMAAAKIPGITTIKFASANYMVQDLCVFLESMGVHIQGIGTSTLVIHGVDEIDDTIEGYPSEDPVESMFFLSLAATTKSSITIERCPIDFLELELLMLEEMGFKYSRGDIYTAANGHTKLVDITTAPSELTSAPEKIAPRPYPGINIDNLPFFVPVATQATGRTLIHDWVYENRAIYYMEMTKLGADMVLADVHRVFINGPTKLKSAEVICPPALRPATLILIGMLAAEGKSILYNVYPVNRGYENLHSRLAKIGAKIEAIE